MKPYKNRLLALIDCETTGFDYTKHEIIELAAIIYDRHADKIIDEWSTKLTPRHIEIADQQALVINGYSSAPNTYRGNIKTALIKFNKLTLDCILVGQNITFDTGFIEQAMLEFNIKPKYDRRKLDILSLAWPIVCEKELSGLGLLNLCDYFGISNVGAHSALIDCRRALGVYKCIIGTYQDMNRFLPS